MTGSRLALHLGLVLAIGSSACGARAHDSDIVTVGHTVITEATLAHWMSVLAPEHIVPDPPTYAKCISEEEALAFQSVGTAELKRECSRRYQKLKQEVLEFLISRTWLIDEADERGLGVRGWQIEHRMIEGERRSVGVGSTPADAKLVIEAELSSVRIRRALGRKTLSIGRQLMAAVYRRQSGRFDRPEQRYVDIVERLASPTAARRVMRAIATGSSFAKMALHERIDRSILASDEGKRRPIFGRIFSAPVRVMVGPVPLNHSYAVFEVTKVLPRTVQDFAKVRGMIARQLLAKAQQRALAAFSVAWSRKWTARTNCRRGYVVRGCRQYAVSDSAAGPFSLN